MELGNDHIRHGTLINGKYELLEQLGAGGMGRVFRARQVELDRMVAVKIVHCALVRSTQVLERFQQEAKLAASLRHHHICEVTELGRHDTGEPYLVMPLLEGATLGQMLHRWGPLPIRRACEIVSQTLQALQVAHGRKIVHRDLKPDNIFVTTMGDRADFVKLLDFGISKVLDQDSVLELTRTGAVVGTPYYMSPEQARGDHHIDHRTDLYAMGVILYEALTGRRPFEADSYNRVIFQIQTEAFPAPTSRRQAIPADLERIVLRAMERDPAARYESAAEMEADLQELLAGLETDDGSDVWDSARPDTLVENAPFTPTGADTNGGQGEVSFVGFSIDDSAGSWPPAAPTTRRFKSAAYAVAFAVVLVGAAMLTAFRSSQPEGPSAALQEPQAPIAPTAAAEPAPMVPEAVEPAPAPKKQNRSSQPTRRRKKRAARPPRSTPPIAETPAPPKAEAPPKAPVAKRLTGRLGARIVLDYED